MGNLSHQGFSLPTEAFFPCCLIARPSKVLLLLLPGCGALGKAVGCEEEEEEEGGGSAILLLSGFVTVTLN